MEGMKEGKTITKQKHTCSSIDELPGIARELIRFADGEKIILFNGEMGAGKTTFIKSLCEFFHVNDTISSPTFSLINEYKYDKGLIFHFDFYRLKNEAEALDIGVEEYFYSGHYCFIEWSEKIPHLIPEKHVTVTIELLENDQREFTFQLGV